MMEKVTAMNKQKTDGAISPSVKLSKSKNSKPSNVALSDSWHKIHVLQGDPCLCRFAMDTISEELGEPIRIRLSGSDGIFEVRRYLTIFSSYSDPLILILSQITSDVANALVEIATSGRIRISTVIVLAGENGLDGRSSLAKEVKKRKRVVYLDPIEADNLERYIQHLDNWQKAMGVTLDEDSRRFLIQQRPLRLAKGDKNQEIRLVDLESLESELSKLVPILKTQKQIKRGLAEIICEFDALGMDTWKFINTCIKGDAPSALAILDDMGISKDTLSPLWLLLSQLEFMIGIVSCQGLGMQPDQIVSHMSQNPYSGRFLLPGGLEPDKKAKIPTVNPWRVRKTIEAGLPTMDRLVSSYQGTVNAIRDIRSSVPIEVVCLKLVLSLSGMARYDNPLSQ